MCSVAKVVPRQGLKIDTIVRKQGSGPADSERQRLLVAVSKLIGLKGSQGIKTV